MTIGDQWGWQPKDTNYKSTHDLIHIFADVIGHGGNLLLDIGPKEDGTIPPGQVSRLEDLGKWTHKHAEAIYGTRAGLPNGHFFGPSTLSQDSTTLYLFLANGMSGSVEIKGLDNKIVSVEVLGKSMPLKHRVVGKISWSKVPGLVFIDVPQEGLRSVDDGAESEARWAVEVVSGGGGVLMFTAEAQRTQRCLYVEFLCALRASVVNRISLPVHHDLITEQPALALAAVPRGQVAEVLCGDADVARPIFTFWKQAPVLHYHRRSSLASWYRQAESTFAPKNFQTVPSNDVSMIDAIRQEDPTLLVLQETAVQSVSTRCPMSPDRCRHHVLSVPALPAELVVVARAEAIDQRIGSDRRCSVRSGGVTKRDLLADRQVVHARRSSGAR